MRCKQRNKKLPKEGYRDALMQWHAATRERLIRSGRNDSYHEKWGRFTPEQGFNVDQSPLPFAANSKRTYEMVKKGDRFHKEVIWRSGHALSRFVLVQLVRKLDSQFFRGKGTRISDDEKASWHKDVSRCLLSAERVCGY